MGHPEPAQIRRPAVAGRFYPGEEAELRALVKALLAEAKAAQGPPISEPVPGVRPSSGAATTPSQAARERSPTRVNLKLAAPEDGRTPGAVAAGAFPGPVPKAIIVPHAGYRYSGPIAASAYARLAPAREVVQRIILLGPSHYVELEGLAASTAQFFATPLGLVPVDPEAIERIRPLPNVVLSDAPHSMEHSLEVQLPFLQVLLAGFSLVPLAVGEADAETIRRVLDTLWGGPETRLVISSDLSHYHSAETARRLDQATAAAIEALQPEGVFETSACGCRPIHGLLQAAQARGLRARTVDLRNSGDTGGPPDRVVGYGAFVFQEHSS